MIENPPLQSRGSGVFEISAEPPPGWKLFLEENAAGVLLTPEWVEATAKGYRAKSLYTCIRENGRIKTGMSGIIYDFIFFRMFFSNVPYGGIIGDSDHSGFLLSCLESELKKRKVHQVRITNSWEYSFQAPPSYLEKTAFQHSLDLHGLKKETLWNGYKKNVRRDIRKARRSGLQVRVMQSAQELPDYYRLYHLTMRRNASLCHYTQKLYEEIERQFVQTGNGAVLFADYNGKPAAALLLVFSHDRAYLIGNVSDPELLRLCPNDLLYHTAIEMAIGRKLSCFDFMTSEYTDEQLMKFKEKWGAVRRPFGIYQKNLSEFHCLLWKMAWAFAASFGRFFLNHANF